MNIILKTSQFLFPLITFPYVSRVLGAGPNGKISFATSVIGYFTLIACLGIPTYGIRKCAEVRDNPLELTKVVYELSIINIFCTVISYIILFILILIIPRFRSDSLLFIVTSFTIILNTVGVDWFYQAIEQYDYITVRNIIFKLLSIVLMFIFVHSPKDYVVYAGIMVIGNVGSNILNVIRLPHYLVFRRFKHYNLRRHLKPTLVLFLYTSATMIYTNLDQVMLGFMSTNKEVGYYAATVKIKNILVNVVTALGAVMLPRITYYLNKGDKKRTNKLLSESFEFIFLISFPLALYFIVEAKEIILFLAGYGYDKAIPIMQIIAPSIIFIGLGSVTAWQMLIPLKKEVYTVYSAIVGAFVNLIINIWLIPIIGGIGASIGTDFAELSVFIVQLVALRKEIRGLIKFSPVLITFFASSCSFAVVILFKSFVLINSNFMSCVLTFVIFSFTYFVILILPEMSI